MRTFGIPTLGLGLGLLSVLSYVPGVSYLRPPYQRTSTDFISSNRCHRPQVTAFDPCRNTDELFCFQSRDHANDYCGQGFGRVCGPVAKAACVSKQKADITVLWGISI